MTVGSIMNQVYLTSGGLTKGCKAVTLTGGEPLYCKSELDRMQTRDLIDTLTYNRFEVNVETNGSIDLNPWKDVVRQNGFFTMDWKSVSSGFSKSMIPSNLQILDENDVLKFVVGTVKDLDQMKDVIEGTDDDFSVLSGDDNLALDLIKAGGDGVISVASNLFPREMVRMVHSAMEGNWDEADRLGGWFRDFFSLCFVETNPIPIKTAMAHAGWCRESFRLPMCPLESSEHRNALFQCIDRMMDDVKEGRV